MNILNRVCHVVLALYFTPAFAQSDLNVYFGNLHSHTSYSDGSGIPRDAYRHSRDIAKLDFMAIIKHNHAAASGVETHPELYNGTSEFALIKTANRFTVDGEFVALYGQEVSSISSGNHANVLDIEDVVKTSDVTNGCWDKLLGQWITRHKDSRGNTALVLLNHPSTSKSPNNKEYGRDDFDSFEAWRSTLDQHAQLINIINGPFHSDGDPGRPSESEYRRYLNMGFHLAPTADQDNHKPNWGSAADTRTGVVAAALAKDAILNTLRARHVYATEDKNLSIICRVNGVLMGSIVTGNKVPNPGSDISLEVTIDDADEPAATYELEVFSDNIGGNDDAGVVRRVTASGNGVHSTSNVSYTGGNQYLFVKVTQLVDDGVGHNRAWLAPVWFESSTPVASQTASSGTETGSPSLSLKLRVDEIAELAVIANHGTESVDLSGWTLISERGNQQYVFPQGTTVSGASSLTVVSGPASHSVGANKIAWTRNNMWRNAGDAGRLINRGGGETVASD